MLNRLHAIRKAKTYERYISALVFFTPLIGVIGLCIYDHLHGLL